MKALILAGGFGTRLRPLSCTRPKTLFPIVNRPLLQWIYERLAENDVAEAILAVNKQTEWFIKQKKLKKHGLKIRYSSDPLNTPLGTAGPIKRAEKLIGHDEPFLVLNGDIFADLSYREILETHRKRKAVGTIALCEVENPSRYGVAELDRGNRIKRFIEKPDRGTAPTNFINAGVYVVSPKIFDFIQKGKAVSMEREIFPQLAQKRVLYGHVTHGLWMDIGKPDEYLKTNKILLDQLFIERKWQYSGDFTVRPSVALDNHVTVESRSVVGPYAVLGKGVHIGRGVQIRDSVIFPNVKIGDSSSIEGAIIGEGASIGKTVKVGRGCIVGDRAKIRDDVLLSEEVAICPGKEVSENILEPKMLC